MAERDDRAELEALDETLFVAWADALPRARDRTAQSFAHGACR